MNDFYLIRKNLTRNRLRMILNCFAIFIAFLLLGALGSIRNAFDAGVELSADDRLVVVNKISFTQTMPVAYVNKIRAIEGVQKVTWANWFGGYFQEPRNMVVMLIVDPESYLDVYPEMILPDSQREAWFKNRQGVIIGEALALTYGWSLGDRIPISSNIFSHKEGGSTWEMVVEGIFSASNGRADTNYMLMHHTYFFETQSYGGEWVGWLTLTTGDPEKNEVVSRAIDAEFANSSAETETTTEAAFNRAFIEQFGNISLIIQSVVMAAFFTILLIVGNSMVLSVRERAKEIAVLKTLGFPAPRVFRMVLFESLLLAVIGGVLGMLVAQFMVEGMSNSPQIARIFPNLAIDSGTWATALTYMVLLGLLTGVFPAYRALTLNTITALGKG